MAGQALIEPRRFLDALRAEAELLLDAARRVAPTTPVRTCPGFTVNEVVRHVGGVYRVARLWILERRDPQWYQRNPVAGQSTEDYMRAGLVELLAEFHAHDADSPAATWWPADRTYGFWYRRTAHETTMHRVDVQQAVADAEGHGTRPTPAPDLGSSEGGAVPTPAPDPGTGPRPAPETDPGATRGGPTIPIARRPPASTPPVAGSGPPTSTSGADTTSADGTDAMSARSVDQGSAGGGDPMASGGDPAMGRAGDPSSAGGSGPGSAGGAGPDTPRGGDPTMAGGSAPITPIADDFAVDGIDEALAVWFGQRLSMLGLSGTATKSVGVRAGGHHWIARAGPGFTEAWPCSAREAERADALVSGSPMSVYLWLWGRRDHRAVTWTGDDDAAGQLWALMRLATR